MSAKIALVDAGPLIAYYNRRDRWHSTAVEFFENYRGQLVTSEPVVTEVMWLLSSDYRVQNEFLRDLSAELFTVHNLSAEDFKEILALNTKFRDLPADFADLSIVLLSKRMKLLDVVSLDGDFDIYKSCGQSFRQLFPRWE